MRTSPGVLALAAFCAVTLAVSAAAERPPSPGITTLTSSPATLAMDVSGGRPMVRLRIDGHGPYDFLVDTGAESSVIDEGLAMELGLPQVGQLVLHSPGSPDGVQGRLVQPGSLEGGALRIERPVLATFDLATYSAGEIDGVLGRAHFADLLLTIDYPASRLVVEKGTLDAENPGVLKMELGEHSVGVRVDLAGRSFPMDLDSGSQGGFTLPKRLQSDLTWRSPPRPGPTIQFVGGSFESWLGELDGTLRLGSLFYENPQVALTTYADHSGNIGMLVLRDLRVTLDQAGGLIAFVRPTAPTPQSRVEAQGDGGEVSGVVGPVRTHGGLGGPPRLGVRFAMTPGGFVRQRGGLVVEGVDDGGAAATAGLRTGDVVVKVGDEAVAGVDSFAELGALLRGARPLLLEVLRGDERLEIAVP